MFHASCLSGVSLLSVTGDILLAILSDVLFHLLRAMGIAWCGYRLGDCPCGGMVGGMGMGPSSLSLSIVSSHDTSYCHSIDNSHDDMAGDDVSVRQFLLDIRMLVDDDEWRIFVLDIIM